MRRILLPVALFLSLTLAVAWQTDDVPTEGAGVLGHWTWDRPIPGRAIALDAAARAAVSLSYGSVTEASVREVVSASRPSYSISLLSAPDYEGRPCFTAIRNEIATNFDCAGEALVDDAVVTYAIYGGPRIGVTTRAALVGVARADVTRVTVTLTDGEEVDLPMNAWRGFSYVAEGPHEIPSTVNAYDADGSIIDRESAE
jgi:hypothetical protein